MSVGINFKESSGYLFYATDSNGNNLSIKLGNSFYLNREFIYNFNGKKFTRKSGTHSTYSINQFSTLLKLEKNNLYYEYDNQLMIEDAFNGDKLNSDSLPIHYKVGKNKTYIFIGHIPPNNTLNSKYTNYLIGCLDFLYINYEKISLQSNGSEEVSSSCWKELSHNICINKKCEGTKLTENILDCTFSAINVKEYCNRDLSNYQNQTQTFERVGDRNQSTGIKFVWKVENNYNYCLLELILKDDSVVLFYINNETQIVIYNQNNSQTKILFEKGQLKNLIYILIIKFDFPNIFIKISNGSVVNSYIMDYILIVKRINIGFSSNFNECQTLKGETAFRYDFSKFQPILNPKSDSKNDTSNISIFGLNLKHLIFTTILIVMNILLTISVITVLIRRKENRKFPSVKSLNIYETIDFQHTPLPNPEENRLRESGVYDYTN